MISIICVQVSIVIVNMLNKFIIIFYFEAKVNNILCIIIIPECSETFMLIEMYKNTVSSWLIWRWRLLNRHFRFRKRDI